MVETRHVKLGYEEALIAKKELLSIELNLLNVLKNIKKYRLLRKKELNAKTKLRTNLNALRLKSATIQSYMPMPEVKKDKRKAVFRKLTKEQNLQEELKEIEKKLSRLR